MNDYARFVPSAPAGRFDGIQRPYAAAEVESLRGSFPITHTLAERGANRLWKSLQEEPYINALGAVTATRRCRWSARA